MQWKQHVPTTPIEKRSFKKKLPNLNIIIIEEGKGINKHYLGSYVLPNVSITKDTPPEKVRPLLETGAKHWDLNKVINRIVNLQSFQRDTPGCPEKSLVAQAIFLHENGQWYQLKTTEIKSWNDWGNNGTWPQIEKNTLKIENIRGVTYESILHVSAAILGTGPKVPPHIYRLHVPEYVLKSGQILNPKPTHWVTL